jgi:hypothetical protein
MGISGVDSGGGIYFSKYEHPGIWRMPVSSGPEKDF